MIFEGCRFVIHVPMGQAMEKLGHAARHRGQHILAKSSRYRGRDWEAH